MTLYTASKHRPAMVINNLLTWFPTKTVVGWDLEDRRSKRRRKTKPRNMNATLWQARQSTSRQESLLSGQSITRKAFSHRMNPRALVFVAQNPHPRYKVTVCVVTYPLLCFCVWLNLAILTWCTDQIGVLSLPFRVVHHENVGMWLFWKREVLSGGGAGVQKIPWLLSHHYIYRWVQLCILQSCFHPSIRRSIYPFIHSFTNYFAHFLTCLLYYDVSMFWFEKLYMCEVVN